MILICRTYDHEHSGIFVTTKHFQDLLESKGFMPDTDQREGSSRQILLTELILPISTTSVHVKGEKT